MELLKPSAAVPAAVPVEVTINAWPWAEVILDGESLGYTPRAIPFKIDSGQHTLVLKNPHLGEQKLVLDLVPERSQVVSVDMTSNDSLEDRQ
jgi:hypothetical protein